VAGFTPAALFKIIPIISFNTKQEITKGKYNGLKHHIRNYKGK